MLGRADILINGKRPHDIQVSNDRLFSRVLKEGSLGFGEAYMEGWWDAKNLDEFFNKLLRADIDRKVKGDIKTLAWFVGQTIINRQTKRKTRHIGEYHYDLGNDLYDAMLDRRKVYTCGYWKHAKNLDIAQEAKLDLVCRKIGLKKGQRIIDIGCGWGSFAKFAAEKYGVQVDGVTVSKEQIELGNKLCAGLPVRLMYKDYRDIEGKYDHIVSLGMFEHVGYKNFRTYMRVVSDHLSDQGLFLLHTIGGNLSYKSLDPWIGKYIFPNSLIPSAVQITKATEKIFVIEDWHNFGPDYDRTLLAWFKNFDENWSSLAPKYGERFYRMWKYYLLMCAGTFRSRKNQLWQIVLSKNGVSGGYESIR